MCDKLLIMCVKLFHLSIDCFVELLLCAIIYVKFALISYQNDFKNLINLFKDKMISV